MDRKEFYDTIYLHIENCASLEYVINEIKKNKEVLSMEDIIRIIRYWKSFGTTKI